MDNFVGNFLRFDRISTFFVHILQFALILTIKTGKRKYLTIEFIYLNLWKCVFSEGRLFIRQELSCHIEKDDPGRIVPDIVLF